MPNLQMKLQFLLAALLARVSTTTQTQYESFLLDTPPLEVIISALHAGLSLRYEEVSTKILQVPPDLRQYGWVAEGLSDCTLLDHGNSNYLGLTTCTNTTYNITKLVETVAPLQKYASAGAWYGASAGYRPVLGRNGEAVNNFNLTSLHSASWGSIVLNSTIAVRPLRSDSVGPFGNLFLTAGRRVPVMYVSVRGVLPSDEERFDWALAAALTAAESSIGSVGLAGFIRLTSGEVTFHVMQDFADHDLTPKEKKNSWIRYFHPINAPLDCVTRLVSNRSLLDNTTKGAHTHCRSSTTKGQMVPHEVGHYENDTTPAPHRVKHAFEAYLVPAKALVRVVASNQAGCRGL